MVTFLSGGTGTPKLLDGAPAAYAPEEITIVANTGDDVELGGLLVCPDVDTLIYQGGGVLNRERWWGISQDTGRTHTGIHDIGSAMGLDAGPRYLDQERQTAGRPIAAWRRFSGAMEFMEIGDRDRAVHVTRTSLLDEGHTLTEVTDRLCTAFGFDVEVLPMSDDPVASLVHTPEKLMHFQEFWIAHGGEPTVENVEFRGSSNAEPAPGVLDALDGTVVIGPSNPVTSIGPMLAMDGVADALWDATVVAVSPFRGGDAFSGPAGKLMESVGAVPSTEGLAQAYPFADAFVVDDADDPGFDRPTVSTDVEIDDQADAARVIEAVERAIELA